MPSAIDPKGLQNSVQHLKWTKSKYNGSIHQFKHGEEKRYNNRERKVTYRLFRWWILRMRFICFRFCLLCGKISLVKLWQMERLAGDYKVDWKLWLKPKVSFANNPGDPGSIPGRVISKIFKMVLDTYLLNTQYYKVRIKSKVEQSRERTSV